MHITLDALGEIIIDHTPHAPKIHPSRHDLCTHHYPRLALSHPVDAIFALLLRHLRME